MADPNMEHPAVKAYRDVFRMTPNRVYRQEIIDTVSPEGDLGLELWASILKGWYFYRDGKKVRRNPLNIGQLLTAYEEIIRRENGANRAGGS